ncbi:MAG: LPS assembly protein LptD [Gammaproteobacteria bacterium]|nr:LPS assembly protein LptD [Gammaproteobacteria bacterium]
MTCLPVSVLADNKYDPETICPDNIVKNPPVTTPQNNKTIINADNSSVEGSTFILNGNVIIQNQGQTLKADQITYDQSSGDARLQGNIALKNKTLTLKASQGNSNTKNQTASFKDIEYKLNNFAGRGVAASAAIKKTRKTHLKKITYTTCKKSKEDWIIKADKVTLDPEDEIGYAKNVMLKFKGVPLFYLPKFSFPTGDKRKSGFLEPTLGNYSSTGSIIQIPWYWNIAPDRDATFNLRYMSDRGTQLGVEYRQLNRSSSSNLKLEYLNDDLIDKSRNLVSIQHQGRYFNNWKVRADLSRVSDQQYFNDLRQGFNLSSVTQLTRVVDVRRDNQYGYLLARAHEFQAINTSNSYQRLPQLSLNLENSFNNDQVRYSLEGELTRFDNRDNVITGTRLDLLPGLEYDWNKTAYYIRPKLMFRYTRYQLENTGIGQQNTLNRSTPIASIDTGLFFERPISIAGQQHTMTLEPRLYYLYAEYDDQSTLPVFDTSLPDFRFADLFRHNQFTGPDRQSNANQLTLAASSRMIDAKEGREWLRLSIGQTFYFDDPQVTLPGQIPVSSNLSDFVGELETRINDRSHFRISGLWDSDQNQPKRGIISYRYNKDNKHHLGVNYRFQRNLFEQTDITGRWRLSRKWHAIGRWTYSLRDEQSIDSLAGLEYENCCWSVQFAGRRHLNSNGIGMENAFYIQLNLKGLSSIGKNIDDFLDSSKLGYISRSTVQ